MTSYSSFYSLSESNSTTSAANDFQEVKTWHFGKSFVIVVVVQHFKALARKALAARSEFDHWLSTSPSWAQALCVPVCFTACSELWLGWLVVLKKKRNGAGREAGKHRMYIWLWRCHAPNACHDCFSPKYWLSSPQFLSYSQIKSIYPQFVSFGLCHQLFFYLSHNSPLILLSFFLIFLSHMPALLFNKEKSSTPRNELLYSNEHVPANLSGYVERLPNKQRSTGGTNRQWHLNSQKLSIAH